MGRVEFLSLKSSFLRNEPNGVGTVADMGGKALPEASLVEKGFLGAAVDMGGNAALLELFSASFTSSFFDNVPKGLGAVADMRENMLPEAGLVE